MELTVGEADILASAPPATIAMGDSGDLKALHEKVNSLTQKVESEFLLARDGLERVITQINDREDEITAGLGVDRLRTHGDESIFDTIGFARGSLSLENLSIIRGAWQETGNEDLAAAYSQLCHLVKVRAEAVKLQADIQCSYSEKVNQHTYEVNLSAKLVEQ